MSRSLHVPGRVDVAAGEGVEGAYVGASYARRDRCELLGHSTIATTANVYAGVLDSLKDDAADRLTRLLAR